MTSPVTPEIPARSASKVLAGARARRLHPVNDASTWDASTYRESDSWIRTLTASHIDEIDRAVRHLSMHGMTLATVKRDDLRIPGLDEFLAEFLAEDVAKRGFGMIRGFPVDRYTEAECGMFFWALGSHMGKAVSQNGNGDRLGSVRSQGLDYDALNVRGYQTRARLPFHCDPSDVVGLLSINKAKRGGLSSVVSGTSMYNRILAERPQYLDLLYRGFRYDRRGEEAPYQESISDYVPVFSYCGSDLSIRYVRKSMETAQQKLGIPFTPQELEVLDYMEELSRSPDLVYSMMMEPGDMQFCNNYTVLHSRTDYEEQEDPARRRHLMRLWLKVPGIRQLAPEFVEYDAKSGWSRREGIPARGAPMPIEEELTEA